MFSGLRNIFRNSGPVGSIGFASFADFREQLCANGILCRAKLILWIHTHLPTHTHTHVVGFEAHAHDERKDGKPTPLKIGWQLCTVYEASLAFPWGSPYATLPLYVSVCVCVLSVTV